MWRETSLLGGRRTRFKKIEYTILKSVYTDLPSGTNTFVILEICMIQIFSVTNYSVFRRWTQSWCAFRQSQRCANGRILSRVRHFIEQSYIGNMCELMQEFFAHKELSYKRKIWCICVTFGCKNSWVIQSWASQNLEEYMYTRSSAMAMLSAAFLWKVPGREEYHKEISTLE